MKKLTIKTRLTLWFSLLFLFILSISSLLLYLTISEILFQEQEKILKDEATHAISHLVSTLEEEGDPHQFEPHELITAETKLTIFNNEGDISTNDMEPLLIELPLVDDLLRKIEINNNVWLVYDQTVYITVEDTIGVRIGRSLNNIESTLENIRVVIFVSIPILLIIASVISYGLATRGLFPIYQIIKTTKDIRQGNLSHRLELSRFTGEVGILASTFNEMLDRLEVAFKREAEFTSAASHELRTPITVILAQAEEILSGNKKTSYYKKAAKVILSESKRISFLISQLLILARDYQGGFELNNEVIDLGILIKDIVEEMKIIAKPEKIKISINNGKSLKINADQTLVTTLIINIINNSIKYNRKGGYIRISLSREKDYAKISIEDSGIGISKEDIPFIFNRFYMVDKVRTGKSFGLGLSIVKWISDIHGGNIDIDSEPGIGTKIIVRLPVNI